MSVTNGDTQNPKAGASVICIVQKFKIENQSQSVKNRIMNQTWARHHRTRACETPKAVLITSLPASNGPNRPKTNRVDHMGSSRSITWRGWELSSYSEILYSLGIKNGKPK